MRSKPIPIVLPIDEYKILEQIAIKEERDPWQQARWFIRRALAEAKESARFVPEGTADATGR